MATRAPAVQAVIIYVRSVIKELLTMTFSSILKLVAKISVRTRQSARAMVRVGCAWKKATRGQCIATTWTRCSTILAMWFHTNLKRISKKTIVIIYLYIFTSDYHNGE